jgi:predicted ATPase
VATSSSELTALELILERRVEPELAYMFKHALTQDVAYDSLLVQRRRELHALVGRAIEELYADRLAEHYEMLAHHFSKAEDWPRALDYLLKAAEKARWVSGLTGRYRRRLPSRSMRHSQTSCAYSPGTGSNRFIS